MARSLPKVCLFLVTVDLKLKWPELPSGPNYPALPYLRVKTSFKCISKLALLLKNKCCWPCLDARGLYQAHKHTSSLLYARYWSRGHFQVLLAAQSTEAEESLGVGEKRKTIILIPGSLSQILYHQFVNNLGWFRM